MHLPPLFRCARNRAMQKKLPLRAQDPAKTSGRLWVEYPNGLKARCGAPARSRGGRRVNIGWPRTDRRRWSRAPILCSWATNGVQSLTIYGGTSTKCAHRPPPKPRAGTATSAGGPPRGRRLPPTPRRGAGAATSGRRGGDQRARGSDAAPQNGERREPAALAPHVAASRRPAPGCRVPRRRPFGSCAGRLALRGGGVLGCMHEER